MWLFTWRKLSLLQTKSMKEEITTAGIVFISLDVLSFCCEIFNQTLSPRWFLCMSYFLTVGREEIWHHANSVSMFEEFALMNHGKKAAVFLLSQPVESFVPLEAWSSVCLPCFSRLKEGMLAARFLCINIYGDVIQLSQRHGSLMCPAKEEILNSWNWLRTNSLVMSQHELVFLSTRWQILGPFSAVCFEFVREWSEMFLKTRLRSSSAALKQIAFDFNWY